MGSWYTVHCAVRADGSTSPAREFLDALKEGMWEPDPEAKGLPHDEQIRDYDRFLDLVRRFATTGVLPMPSQLNCLRDGHWEFKVHLKRLSFYDTDGCGGYEPKLVIQDRRQADHDDDDWRIPDFDECVRLAHAFPKLTERTPEYDHNQMDEIRREDLSHDEP